MVCIDGPCLNAPSACNYRSHPDIAGQLLQLTSWHSKPTGPFSVRVERRHHLNAVNRMERVTCETIRYEREVSLCSFSDTLHRYGSHTGLPGETVCRVVTLDTLEGRTGQGLTLEHPQSL